MAQYLPKLRVRSGEQIGNEIFFQFPDLQDEQRTYLDADSAAGDTSLSAAGMNFSTGQYIVIGQPGNVKTEIVQINGSPTATSIPLAAGATFPHNRGDVVRFIPFNQIVPEWGTSATGSFTALSAIGIRADSTETYLNQTSDPSTYWYRSRFKNSTTSLFSAYSDTIPGTGMADNTIGAVKLRALDQLGEKLSDLVTDRKMNDWIQEARRMADQNPAVMRWSFRTAFQNVTGQLLSGQWRIAIPANLRDQNSPKNVLSIRVANQNRPVIYQDRVRFNQNYLNVNHSTVATQLTGAPGPIAAVIIYTNNHNYIVGDVLTLTGGSGDATLTVTAVDGSGHVVSVSILNPGTSYTIGTVTGETGGHGSAMFFQVTQTITTLTLSSTADFDPVGAVTLSNNSIGDGLINLSYTGNNRATGVLSGVTGINRTILAGTDVWQRAVFGLPTAYTVGGDGYWYFDVPLKIDYDGMNVKDDHYTVVPAISSDDQAFDEPFYDLYVSWLRWRIKYAKANGKIARDGDPDYKEWLTGLSTLIGQEFPGQRMSFVPDVEGFLSATE